MLSEALEDYLETIFFIEKSGERVRVKDIAGRLQVKNASVTVALRALEKKKYINYKPYGLISLTKNGEERAREISKKHRMMQLFFENYLGVDAGAAEDAACRMEHALSDEIFFRFVSFLRYLRSVEEMDPAFLDSLQKYIQNDTHDGDFTGCIRDLFSYFGNKPQ